MTRFIRLLCLATLSLLSPRGAADDLLEYMETDSPKAGALASAAQDKVAKDPVTAFRLAEEALAVDPHCGRAKVTRARALINQKRLKEAHQALSDILDEAFATPQFKKSFTEAAGMMSDIYFMQDRQPESLFWASWGVRLEARRPGWGITLADWLWPAFYRSYSRMPPEGFVSLHKLLSHEGNTTLTNWMGSRRQPPPEVIQGVLTGPNHAILELEANPIEPRAAPPVELAGRIHEAPACSLNIALGKTPAQLFSDYGGGGVWLVATGTRSLWWIDAAGKSPKAFTTAEHPALAGCAVPEGVLLGKHYQILTRLGPDGKETKLKGTSFDVGDSMAYCPRTRLLFVCNLRIGISTHRLDGTGVTKNFSRQVTGTRMALDPERARLYTLLDGPQLEAGQTAASTVHTRLFDAMNLHMRTWLGAHATLHAYDDWGIVVPASTRMYAAPGPYSTISVSAHGEEVVIGGGDKVVEGRIVNVARTFSWHHFTETPRSYPAKEGTTLRGVHVHPFSAPVALIDSEGLRFFARGSSQPSVEFPGEFATEAAWSADGRLFVCLRKTGDAKKPWQVTAYSYDLDDNEKKLSAALAGRRQEWLKEKAPSDPPALAAQAPQTPARPTGLETFSLDPTPGAGVRLLKEAMDAPGDRRPVAWDSANAYAANGETRVADIRTAIATVQPKDAVFGLARAKKWFEKSPDFPPALYARGLFSDYAGKSAEAKSNLVAAVQLDAGRTSLSRMALVSLGQSAGRRKDENEMLQCFAGIFRIEPPSAELLKAMEPVITRNGLSVPAAVREVTTQLTHSVNRPGKPKPVLELPLPGNQAALSGPALHQLACRGVVSLRVDDRLYTAILVTADGHLITCGDAGAAPGAKRTAVFYQVEGNQLKRQDPVPAEVVFHAPGADLTLLRVAQVSPGAQPLPLATVSPPAGTKVFHLGGVEDKSGWLDHTLTAGLISAANRTLDGKTYLQHSAAVSAGGLGAPLLTANGQVAGITLRAGLGLENTALALPAAEIRAFLVK